jgi:cellulose synthase operon protein C
MPGDLEAKIRRAPPDAREEVRIQVEDRIRQVLDERVRPIECLAVARYALAARAARAGNLDTEYTRQATDRLQAYGDERIAECVAQAAAQDASFSAYQPGEFSRAPRGQTRQVRTGVSAPPLGPVGR